MALVRYEADRCAGCGGDLHETTAAEADDAYGIDPPIRCHRCTAMMRAADQYKDSPYPMALMHRVSRRR